jgi:hypothetical protein
MLHPLRMKQEKDDSPSPEASAFFDIDKKRPWITRYGRKDRRENKDGFLSSLQDRQPSFREPFLRKNI